MKSKYFVAVLAFAATPAFAAGTAIQGDQNNLPAVNWSGFYVGVGVGYHAGNIKYDGCTGLCPSNPELNGGAFGIQAGYDHEFANKVVLGAFAAIPLTGPEGSFNIGTKASPFIFRYKTEFVAILGARLGYAYGRFLPYVTAGFNVARVKAESGPFTETHTHSGYQIGAGVEFRVTDHISTDFRYSYSDTSKETYSKVALPSNWGESASTVTAAINWRF